MLSIEQQTRKLGLSQTRIFQTASFNQITLDTLRQLYYFINKVIQRLLEHFNQVSWNYSKQIDFKTRDAIIFK
jgi:hypothetical protein